MAHHGEGSLEERELPVLPDTWTALRAKTRCCVSIMHNMRPECWMLSKWDARLRVSSSLRAKGSDISLTLHLLERQQPPLLSNNPLTGLKLPARMCKAHANPNKQSQPDVNATPHALHLNHAAVFPHLQEFSWDFSVGRLLGKWENWFLRITSGLQGSWKPATGSENRGSKATVNNDPSQEGRGGSLAIYKMTWHAADDDDEEEDEVSLGSVCERQTMESLVCCEGFSFLWSRTGEAESDGWIF